MACMDWSRLISDKRFGLEDYHDPNKSAVRTDFRRDFDRLVFSSPFRRLQNKTQVFPLPGSIFVHNRLTHSMEVSCVGRSMGADVAVELSRRYPELREAFGHIGDIVAAACLAHDLGNPPFGHSGEKAIAAFFSEGEGQPLKDKMAADIIAAAMPDYAVVPVDCSTLILQHGSLHCSTMQLPPGTLAI